MYLIRPQQFDKLPKPNEVIEISRRLKTGQRPRFDFVSTLRKLIEKDDLIILGNPDDVRVNLVSRYDNLVAESSAKTANLGIVAISQLFNVMGTSSCDEYSSLALKEPTLINKGNGWSTIEMPIQASDCPFDEERLALIDRIDKKLDEPGSLWYPDTPALQIVEFKADSRISDAILEFVTVVAPRQTEVFEASVRFRPSVLSSD